MTIQAIDSTRSISIFKEMEFTKQIRYGSLEVKWIVSQLRMMELRISKHANK